MNVTDYTVVSSCLIGDLVECVREKIADGWQPFGSPWFDADNRNTYQALAKYGASQPNQSTTENP